MRRLLAYIFLLTSSTLHLFAYDVEVDGVYFNVIGSRAYVTHRGASGSMEANSYSGNVVVPEQITYRGKAYTVFHVGPNAFACCDELTSVQLPSTVTGLGPCAFLGCPKLQKVLMPATMRVLGACSFTGCLSLQEVTFPRYKESVDTLSFYCCSSLTSLVLPHRVRTVCQGALEHLPSMTDLYVFASLPPVAEPGSFTLSDQQKCTLHVPKETLKQYRESPVWKDFYRIVALSDNDYAAQNYRRGDINDDGLVDADDLALLRLIVVSLPDDSAVRWAADINSDGKVNGIDYVMLAKKLSEQP